MDQYGLAAGMIVGVLVAIWVKLCEILKEMKKCP